MKQRRLHISATLISAGVVFLISVWQIWIETPATSLALEKSLQTVLGDIDQAPSPTITKPETFPYVVDARKPVVQSNAVAVYDPTSDTFLYEINGNRELPVASLMKIVTALVAEKEYTPEERIQIPQSVYTIDGSRVHLVADDVLSAGELIAAALIPSGNDAAYSLAAAYPQGYEQFIQKMNEFVSQYGLMHTRINNPVGYDFTNQYSSARDIAILSAKLLESPMLAKIVGTQRMNVDGEKKSYLLVNTNRLLFSHDEVTGLKTGTSEVAGENLVFSWVRDGRILIGVVLGSSQRFTDAETLMQWVERAYVW